MYIHINSLNDPCFQLLQEESCKERSCREAPGKRQKAATYDVAEGHADAQSSAISSSPRPVTRRPYDYFSSSSMYVYDHKIIMRT